MSLTQEQIEKLLKNLSKLGVQNSEKLTENLNSIINYMDILNEVDTTDVVPTVSVVEKKNTLRADVQTSATTDPADLLSCSPQKVVANQIAIGNIMK